MPKLVSIDDQRYAALTLQSLRVMFGPLQASTTSLESQESYLTAGMLPYNRNVTLQTFLSSTRDFYRLHSTFARLYNAAASPASRLRSAGSLAIMLPPRQPRVFARLARWQLSSHPSPHGRGSRGKPWLTLSSLNRQSFVKERSFEQDKVTAQSSEPLNCVWITATKIRKNLKLRAKFRISRNRTIIS